MQRAQTDTAVKITEAVIVRTRHEAEWELPGAARASLSSSTIAASSTLPAAVTYKPSYMSFRSGGSFVSGPPAVPTDEDRAKQQERIARRIIDSGRQSYGGFNKAVDVSISSMAYRRVLYSNHRALS